MSDVPTIEMRGISKSFPAVKALRGVSFSCARGEVHAESADETPAPQSTDEHEVSVVLAGFA